MENLLSFVLHVLDKHMKRFKAVNAVESKGIVYSKLLNNQNQFSNPNISRLLSNYYINAF